MICEQTQTIPIIVAVPKSKGFISQLQWRLSALLNTNASAKALASSFAMGTLISVLPTPGLNFLLAAFLLTRFKQLNKAALLAAVGVWNGFVVAPLYALSYQVGGFLFGTAPEQLIKGFLVGNLIIAISITAVSYFGVKTAVNHSRK